MKTMEERKKKRCYISKKKKKKWKGNGVTILISADGEGIFFPVKLKLEWELFELKYLRKRI